MSAVQVLWALLQASPGWGQGGAVAAIDSVDRFVQVEMARQRIPGMSVAVLRGDSVLMARGYGYANLEHRVPAGDSTVYQSGSVGKQFTAALVLMLVEKGRLRLDDPIVRYLPEGKKRWRQVTVRHLLNHTSGIPDYTDSTVDLHREYTEDELIRVAARLPLGFPPGERWSYSNTGYLLLGALVHRVTGSFYGDLLREWIFRPLRMPTARIISEEDVVPNRAAGYRLVKGEIKNQEWVSPSLNTTADGSLYLALRDYIAWARALNHGVLPSRHVLDMAWSAAPLNHGASYPYGAGWMLLPQRRSSRIGHTGSWQGFQTSIQRYPEFGLTVVALANLGGSHPGPLSEAIAGIYEPELAAPHTLPPAAEPDSTLQRIPAVLTAWLEKSADNTVGTAGFRRFTAAPWKMELKKDLDGVTSWEPVTCDSLPSGRLVYLDAPVARACYVRGKGPEARLLVTVYYSGDARIAGIETSHY